MAHRLTHLYKFTDSQVSFNFSVNCSQCQPDHFVAAASETFAIVVCTSIS